MASLQQLQPSIQERRSRLAVQVLYTRPTEKPLFCAIILPMSTELAQRVSLDFESAYYAESNGNLTEALRLYRLVWGYYSRLDESEKDGMRMRFGNLKAKIADLELQVARSITVNAGKIKRVNLTYQRPNCEVDDCYYR